MTFIRQIVQDNGNIALNKFEASSFPKNKSNQFSDDVKKICFLDLETTGLNKDEDTIIEIALKLVGINETTGELLGVISEYQSFQDPEFPIDERITLINGINDKMVKGLSIDWSIVHDIINDSFIVEFISHPYSLVINTENS